MLKRQLYTQGKVKLLVTTETRHSFTQDFVQKFYSVHVEGEWFRLHEGLIEKAGETPEQVIAHWSGYVAHQEDSASVNWIEKYDLPKAEVIKL